VRRPAPLLRAVLTLRSQQRWMPTGQPGAGTKRAEGSWPYQVARSQRLACTSLAATTQCMPPDPQPPARQTRLLKLCMLHAGGRLQGLLDPWHGGGVLESLSDTLVAVILPGVRGGGSGTLQGATSCRGEGTGCPPCSGPSALCCPGDGRSRAWAARRPPAVARPGCSRLLQGAHHLDLMFSNPRVTPWVLALLLQGAHHLDLMFSNRLDSPDVTRARATELQHIRRWVQEARRAVRQRGPAVATV